MTTTESENHEPGADKKPSNVQPDLGDTCRIPSALYSQPCILHKGFETL